MKRCPHCSFDPTSESDYCDRHSWKRRPEWQARQFHEAYERLAPLFGYETRPETKQFDPTSKNGRLMIAVMEELAEKIGLETD